MVKALDLDGKRFGRLIATNKIRLGAGQRYERLCHCDCGDNKWILESSLKSNRTKSCGCWWGKLKFGQTTRNNILCQYKHQAKLRNLEWSLTDDEFDILTSGLCFFCNMPPSNVKKSKHRNGDFVYNGIDRLNSSLGYVKTNTVSCCAICNRAKSDMKIEDFIAWAKALGVTVYARY